MLKGQPCSSFSNRSKDGDTLHQWQRRSLQKHAILVTFLLQTAQHNPKQQMKELLRLAVPGVWARHNNNRQVENWAITSPTLNTKSKEWSDWQARVGHKYSKSLTFPWYHDTFLQQGPASQRFPNGLIVPPARTTLSFCSLRLGNAIFVIKTVLSIWGTRVKSVGQSHSWLWWTGYPRGQCASAF